MNCQLPTSPAPLAVFRIGFGLMMALSIVRFWANGWIEKLYLEPTYFFSYQYFEWVKPLGSWTYLLFGTAFISALMVMLGWKYRLAIVIFFLSFTYIELMDKTTYLNHYYFITLLSFVLIWLPAAACFSMDARGRKVHYIPRWTIDSLKIFVGVVYFYAGLAKLNSDWLLEAQPLAIWLPAKYNIPLLGDLLQQRWVHYGFAWSGAAYDLLIPFLLFWRPTRVFAFVMVVVFHVLTRVLFPIGMFPYIMIVSALIFFDEGVHERLLTSFQKVGVAFKHKGLRGISILFRKYWRSKNAIHQVARPQVQIKDERAVNDTLGNSAKMYFRRSTGYYKKQSALTPSAIIVSLTLLAHLTLPWRYALHPGELFWTEEGYRFSWRVMLMEKAGYLTYQVEDPSSGKRRSVDPGRYLTTFQQKQLASQPDFILEFAHFIAAEHQINGEPLPAVFAESYVALNGRGSRVYVNPGINLTTITTNTPRVAWLMPFEDEIYGL
ncbi:HTTM domain-containing protein [Neolewinella persica]|uniref:HTTM domain-containing protein n=1 Tax=Neolewinella persica TaxID=70998 RepID=UPI0003782794|nr:HTTM domain-containing protein [Neolewinella persica]